MSREFQPQEKSQSTSTPVSTGLLQRRAANEHEPETVPPIVNEVLRTPGKPLDAHTRAFMEPRFGHDFNHVRVHTDAKAAESARALNALAYTVGQNIVFKDGQNTPYTSEGRLLLAHELVHVIQQRIGGHVPSYNHEYEATLASRTVVAGQRIHVNSGSSIGFPQYSPDVARRNPTQIFSGPPGRLIDPTIGAKLSREKTIRTVAVGGVWREGYPLVPDVYDGFMNFTFLASLPTSVVVMRNDQFLEISLDNIAAYVRLSPIEKGVWSARWVAVVYPWLLKKSGEILQMHPIGAILGIPLSSIGKEGLKEAAEVGIPEARELAEEEQDQDIITVIGTVERCNLDTSALRDLEKHRGATAREIGIRGKLYTTETAIKEFSIKGDWPKLQRRFSIQTLPRGPAVQRYFQEAVKRGMKVNDADILAHSRAYKMPIVTQDEHFFKVAQQLGVPVRASKPYQMRPGAPRRIAVPRQTPRVMRFPMIGQGQSTLTSGRQPSERETLVYEVLRSPGRPLDPEILTFMEFRLGHDFSHVRVHTGVKAAESARAVNALAYTVGRNVVFSSDQYPSDPNIRRLLAHELAHTIQQRDAWYAPVHNLFISPENDHAEQGAKSSERSFSGTFDKAPECSSVRRSGGIIQRQVTRAFSEETFQPVRETFEENFSRGIADRDSCIAIVNKGFAKMFRDQLRGKSLGSTIEKTMARLRTLHLADRPIEVEFIDSKGRLTTGTRAPASLAESAEAAILTMIGGETGWYVFGLSIMDGYHSVMLAVENSSSSPLKIYWMDQIFGFREATGNVDQAIILATKRWWKLESEGKGKSGKKVRMRTVVRIWPVVERLIGDFPVRPESTQRGIA